MNAYPWLDIIVIVAVVIFLIAVIGNYIYRKVKHLPTGDCAYCKGHNLVKEYRKMFPKDK